MPKRFTDSDKWKDPWFRELNSKAKLAWIYLCDECDFCGIWKEDYSLASFKLNFPLKRDDLFCWFQDRLFLFNQNKILIIPFFNFQYGQSKDTWSAKIKALERLRILGFSIENNRVLLDQTLTPVGDIPPTCGGVVLSIGIGKGIGKGIGNSDEFKNKIKKIYQDHYPKGKKRIPHQIGVGVKILMKSLQESELNIFEKAVVNYKTVCLAEKTEDTYIKRFHNFVKDDFWREFIEIEVQKKKEFVEDLF